ncbi:MAG TPA: DNA polymerase III subunit [Steroidobacteraceae bacterium]|nr:DNA polymerase III subunit [Steroidobacteraceae bacterium]
MSSGTAVTPAWLSEPMRLLAAAHAAGRMPHALLLHAAAGRGGEWLAIWTAELVLCKARTQPRPCGSCPGCLRAREMRHPDLLAVGLPEESQQIRIDEVRALGAELQLTSHEGGYKVAIIAPADALNRFAANALLKTLEEPPARTLLVLVAAQPSRLPATLRSRCQRIAVPSPSRAQALAWLEGSRGPGPWSAVLDLIGEAPFAAAELDPAAVARLCEETRRLLEEMRSGTADPVTTAERWARSELALRLACVENWLTERIRRGLGAATDATELGASAHSRSPDSVMNTRRLFASLEGARELKAALATPINRALALESVLRSMRA